MNLTQISAFQAAMTSASLSDAARKLGRTQPAVSAAIRSLEDQLGLKLFRRDGRKLVPVPEAQYLLTEAEAILSQLAQAKQTMQSLVDGNTGNLAIAAMPGPVSMLFPRFIASQIAGNTATKVSIQAQSSVQIAELARAQNIDFGFADAPNENQTSSLYTADLLSARCFVAVPHDHRLSDAAAVGLRDLDQEPMGTLQLGHEHRQVVAEAFLNEGAEFMPTVECQTFLPVLQFVAAGQCCAILDPLTVVHIDRTEMLSNGICIRPLEKPLVYRYALYAPVHRPISLLATRLRFAWLQEVQDLLERRGASPQIQFAEDRSFESTSS